MRTAVDTPTLICALTASNLAYTSVELRLFAINNAVPVFVTRLEKVAALNNFWSMDVWCLSETLDAGLEFLT